MISTVKTWIYNIFGGIFLFLGIAGVFLPLLPATPFLLLAGFFFSKGSVRFHQWLISHRYLGPPIKDWERNGIIRRSHKQLASLMLLFSALIIFPNSKIPLFGKLGFSGIALLVLIFIWTRPSK